MGLFSKRDKDGQAKSTAAPPPPLANGAARGAVQTPVRPMNGAAQTRPAATPQSPASPVAKTSSAAPVTPPDPKAMQQSLARSRRLHASLGEIISVLMRSPQHRKMTLDQARSIAGPAVATGQFLVANAHDPARGLSEPVAAVLWANVSNQIDAQMADPNGDAHFNLQPSDWQSGDHTWVIAVAGDQRATAQLLNALQTKTLKGRVIKARVKDERGKVIVRTITPSAAQVEKIA